MDNITWSGHEWLTKERWGRVHPDKSFCWYDPECVNVDNKGYLHLTTDKSPNEIQHYNGKTYKPNLGTGLICSVEDFSYGRFEIEAMMPRGRNKWPAFWLWGSETWPPEIDILEGYTDKRNGYLKFNRFNPLGFWNLQTNLWTHGIGEKNYNLRAKTHFFGFKNPAKHFLKYSLLWLPDKISISFNDYLVREITDKDTLAYFNDQKMRVVINNHFQKDSDRDFYSDFVIKQFRYTPYKAHLPRHL